MSPDLERFVAAQQPLYDQVCRELRAGHKRSHWMWFIFPQLAGLGHSPMAQRYAIADLAHAQAYLAHPVLGTRLRECVALLSAHADRTPAQILGYPDDLKLRSSLTLFREAAPAQLPFMQALQLFYDGEPDPATLQLLRR